MSTPSARYVAKMEDVLAVYERPYDLNNPVVCIDECKKELRSTPRGELPTEAGRGKREDYEYVREDAANLFLAVEPLAGRRMISVTERRTAVDFAHFLKRVSDEFCPEANIITVVLDNLNTHKPWSLYATFPAEEAYRLMNRFEFHYTPEHGSWLNMAEIEISVMQRQCLNRRLNRVGLEKEVSAWEMSRNALEGKIDWQFTTEDARVKLRRLYPKLDQIEAGNDKQSTG